MPSIEQARQLIPGQEEFLNLANQKTLTWVPAWYTINPGMFERTEEKKLTRTRHEKTSKIKAYAEEAKAQHSEIEKIYREQV